MLFLDPQNQLIFEILNRRLNRDPNEKAENLDTKGGDFDGTTLTIKSHGENREKINISMKVPGSEGFDKFGLEDLLKKVYGNLYTAPEAGQTATLTIPNADALDNKTKETYLHDIPLLRRHIMSAPFVHAFDLFLQKKKFDPIVIPYREEENIYIVNDDNKNLFVVYSIKFRDPDDIVLAKVFLQEFKDLRKDRSLSNAPGVNFAQGTLPLELKGVKTTEPSSKEALADYGFIVMSMFDRHMEPKSRDPVIDKLISFRSYFHYHLKCAKAYMHIRMRDRVVKLLQNLEGCKDQSGKEKIARTISGRKFERK